MSGAGKLNITDTTYVAGHLRQIIGLFGAIILLCNSPVMLLFHQRKTPSHIGNNIKGPYNCVCVLYRKIFYLPVLS